MPDVLIFKIENKRKIMKLLENQFFFVLFLVGEQIKENYFFYLVNKKYSGYSLEQKQLIR